MRLNEEQRKLWADKLMDLANLSVAALIFGALLSTSRPQWDLLSLGLTIYFLLAIIATWLRR